MKVILMSEQLHEYTLFALKNYLKVADLDELMPLRDLYMALREAQDLPTEPQSPVGTPFVDEEGVTVVPIQGPLKVEVDAETLIGG
jgi:hypothetical protein